MFGAGDRRNRVFAIGRGGITWSGVRSITGKADGTHTPKTIGTQVSSGCTRLTNARVNVGTKVICSQWTAAPTPRTASGANSPTPPENDIARNEIAPHRRHLCLLK
jgi:hypothetical protein